jgi:hypothetical protein
MAAVCGAQWNASEWSALTQLNARFAKYILT